MDECFLSCFYHVLWCLPQFPLFPACVIISVWARCDQEASKIPEDRQLSERFQQNTPQRIDFSWRDALTESPHGDVSGTFASLRVGQLEGFLIWKGEDGEPPFLPHTPADICPIAILPEPYSKFTSSQLVPIIPILQSVYADLVYWSSRRTYVHHSEFTIDSFFITVHVRIEVLSCQKDSECLKLARIVEMCVTWCDGRWKMMSHARQLSHMFGCHFLSASSWVGDKSHVKRY